jgi:hypothetical protein
MSKPKNTPYLRAVPPQPGTAQRARIYGPRHADGGEHAPICEVADADLAKTMAAAYNAIDSAAKKLRIKTGEFVERMQDAQIVDLMKALERTSLVLRRINDGDHYAFKNALDVSIAADAILAEVTGACHDDRNDRITPDACAEYRRKLGTAP